jgi:hypothetical protein
VNVNFANFFEKKRFYVDSDRFYNMKVYALPCVAVVSAVVLRPWGEQGQEPAQRENLQVVVPVAVAAVPIVKFSLLFGGAPAAKTAPACTTEARDG